MTTNTKKLKNENKKKNENIEKGMRLFWVKYKEKNEKYLEKNAPVIKTVDSGSIFVNRDGSSAEVKKADNSAPNISNRLLAGRATDQGLVQHVVSDI